jgi:hypothetical protein
MRTTQQPNIVVVLIIKHISSCIHLKNSHIVTLTLSQPSLLQSQQHNQSCLLEKLSMLPNNSNKRWNLSKISWFAQSKKWPLSTTRATRRDASTFTSIPPNMAVCNQEKIRESAVGQLLEQAADEAMPLGEA